ncbi:peptide-methionine (S)-S-oxide reductase MsrA [Mycoplasma procyoni]|uniref:peptide-methionine (S)-S-oxide reductase MsrA n=1 Tax=Mycoplasma procyoni TaxID=568784 RepID=UPI00197C5172|nr:peptide-methionine (S)-S-oxide reductase MsrA [Mycoplasma procyoni]MBN3535003.1 peptide-methionine (S)-S-oxide reductase MsrA [Mycoplasma procyoni]
MKKELFIAAGCFWGVEEFYRRIKGVLETETFYINGGFEGVSYKEVCNDSSHVEAVRIVYDDQVVNDKNIWDLFLLIVDPYTKNQQGNDKGIQYRSGIYTNDQDLLNEFKRFNEEFKKAENKENYFEFLGVQDKTPAEEYHQKYLAKNPTGYCHISMHSIPENFLKDEYK